MVRGIRTTAFQDIIDDAVGALTPKQRTTTDLYLDLAPYEKGAIIGPQVQGVQAKQRCLIVFVDEDPRANFGHACRYRFYDVRSHRRLGEERARFPPYRPGRKAGTFVRIHDHLMIIQPAAKKHLAKKQAGRKRYAILFSGSSERRHLNQLEYAYRMLTLRYCFKQQHIFVLYYDGTINFVEPETATNWPQELYDSSQPADPYQLKNKISGRGDRAGFQAACAQIAAVLKPRDLVFIQASGHGDADPNRQPESFLLQPNGLAYYVDEFCQDLTALGRHDSLLIMMEQCCSAGFIPPLIAAKATFNASRLSIACASKDVSHPTTSGLFNCFGAGWIASHLDYDPDGVPTPSSVDQDTSGFIEALEAYDYAAPRAMAQSDQPAQLDDPNIGTGSGALIRLA
jgi:hypothetical protein